MNDIAKIPDPEIRIGLYGTLLEWVLKSLTTDADAPKNLDGLIDYHRMKFADFRSVDGARWVRNQLVHSTGEASLARIRTADTDFDGIIRRLAEQYCSQYVRDAVLGPPKPVVPTAPLPVATRPIIATPRPSGDQTARQSQSHTPLAPKPEQTPRSSKNGGAWFLFAFALSIMAGGGIVIWRQSTPPPPQPVQVASPSFAPVKKKKGRKLFLGSKQLRQTDWPTFYQVFSTAVRSRDKATLTGMMSDPFNYRFQDVSPQKALLWMENDNANDWGALERIIGLGNVFEDSKHSPGLRTIPPQAGVGFRIILKQDQADHTWKWWAFEFGD